MRSKYHFMLPTVVILVYSCMHCLAGDLWSPGTQPEVWRRITRLQRVCVTTPVRSPFVSQCCQSDDPIERLAAIAWIGRTQSKLHIPDLELLLSDPIRHVRQLALECLCLLNCPEARQVVAHAVGTAAEISTSALNEIGYRRRTPCGNGPWNLLDMVKGGKLEDRQAELAKASTQRWIQSNEPPCNRVVDIAISLKRSVCDRDQPLEVAFASRAGPAQPIALDSFGLQRLRDLSWVRLGSDFYADKTHTNANPKLIHVENGVYSFQLDGPNGPLSPGIYATRLRTTHGQESSLMSLPLFVRINRSQPDENEIQELLGRVDELPVIKRLGELRVRQAVPSLIARFKKVQDCDQIAVAGSLALIGDGRAAQAFLECATLSCWDSGTTTDIFLNELDITSQVYCVDYLNRARERWNAADDDEKLEPHKVLPGFRAAVAMMNRPLTEQHRKTVEWFLQQQIDTVSGSDPTIARLLFQRIADLLVDYSRGDLQILANWLAKLEEHPQAYLDTLWGICNAQSHRRFRMSRSNYDELIEYLEDWLRRKPQPEIINHRVSQLIQNWHLNFPIERGY